MERIESFIEKSKGFKEDFDALIEEYRSDLWRYCKYLARSPWDGEDLFQETVIKAYGSLYQRFHPTNLKSYLFRIATNTWIDHCRRRGHETGQLTEDIAAPVPTDPIELEDVLEKLLTLLKPRQAAVFLLKEVFQFKAEEVAAMVHTTAGAVYATVNRCREKIKMTNWDSYAPSFSKTQRAEVKNTTIKAYLKALTAGNLEDMLALFDDHATNEAVLGFHEYDKDEMRNGSYQFGIPGNPAEPYLLWGRPVIVVFAEGDNGRQIHDIQTQEVENGKITALHSYFFRKELILVAADTLGIPAQLDKPPVDWR